MSGLRLNLGCSDDLRPGYLNVDVAPPAGATPENFQAADLNVWWPWGDSTVDEITAHHVFEHLANRAHPGNRGKIWAMNQAWRVLKPGGILDLRVPACHLKDGRVSIGAFADPTHVSFWTADCKYYFCRPWDDPKTGERGRLGPAYGIVALFDIEKWDLREYGSGPELRAEIVARLRAVKG